MRWEKRFLCPSCGALEEYVDMERDERQLYSYFLEDGFTDWVDTVETYDPVYYCPRCGSEVDPYEDYVEVDEANRVFRVPPDSSWNNDDSVVELMESHGYKPYDLEEEEQDYELEDLKAEDIFMNKDEIWEV